MKNKSVLQSILTGLFVVLVLAASNSIVRAQSPPTTSWIDPGGDPLGDWFNPDNWSNGVPNALVDAFISLVDPAQTKILGGDAMAYSLTLGENQGDSGVVLVEGSSQVFSALDVGGSTCGGNITIGNRGQGKLAIGTGGIVRSRYAIIGAVAKSNGYVRVLSHGDQGIGWHLYDHHECLGAGLFIGCTATSNSGGTAIVIVADGGTIQGRQF